MLMVLVPHVFVCVRRELCMRAGWGVCVLTGGNALHFNLMYAQAATVSACIQTYPDEGGKECVCAGKSV
jgi:hypothetical protein